MLATSLNFPQKAEVKIDPNGSLLDWRAQELSHDAFVDGPDTLRHVGSGHKTARGDKGNDCLAFESHATSDLSPGRAKITTNKTSWTGNQSRILIA